MGTATNCDRQAGTQGWRTSLAVTQAKRRSNHETRNIGIGDSACLHGHLRARAVQRRLRRRKFGHGRRGNKRHDDADLPPAERPPAMRRAATAGTGMTNSAGSAAAGTNSGAEPVGEHAAQSLAQRFDVDAGSTRLADSSRQITKSPALRGFFIRVVAGSSTSSLPAASCISRRRASPVGRALRSRARWRRARRWRDRESASSPPRSRRRPWPRRSVSR